MSEPSEFPTPPHAAATAELLEAWRVDPARGLSTTEVVARRARWGENRLAEAPPIPWWRKFLAQFRELVIVILIVAAIIAGLMGEWIDAAAVLAIVVLNGVLGFLQEERAGRALAALRNMSSPMARAWRDGAIVQVAASELTPGDIIEIEAGDNVPADARWLTSFGLLAQEAALTGESTPTAKDATSTCSIESALGDRANMAYLGTTIVAGKGRALVVAIGMATELGRIAGLLERNEAEPTPLQRRLAELGRVLVVVCLAIVVVIFALQMLRGGELFEVFLLSVSLAVAAVPEGLPAVVTMALALGLQRMVKRNALIRKLPSVETLGSVTVICSDKTGTLTRNEMTARELLVNGQRMSITGAGYAPRGDFVSIDEGSGRDQHVPIAENSPEWLALAIGAICNGAHLTLSPDDATRWQVVGDPTEGALLVAARKAGVDPQRIVRKIVHELPFDSQRKLMSVIVELSDGRTVMATKGAPEVVLAKCVAEQIGSEQRPLDDVRRAAWADDCSRWAARALRVLAVAYRDVTYQNSGDLAAEREHEDDLVFVGIVGMIDPPRDEAREAVRRCLEAGIRPVMITGDHPATALAIARELGIAGAEDRALTGADLDALDDTALVEVVERTAVYARVSAEHKLRVVRAWQRRGDVVAMTGDGVNDAPAVKAADIGVAMGLTGTDVTKEASDMVLTDDNFASIINAVEEGRGIFDNIQKCIHYLLACNAGEVLFMLFASLLGWPTPLSALQILWINLVTDGLPALALGLEPPERDIMRRRPRPVRDGVLTARRGRLIALHGALIAAATGIGFAAAYRGDETNLPAARTTAFCILALSQLAFSFACRSQSRTLPELGLFTNPMLFAAVAISGLLQVLVVTAPFAQPLFHATAADVWRSAPLLALALAPVTIIESGKLIRSRFRAHSPPPSSSVAARH